MENLRINQVFKFFGHFGWTRILIIAFPLIGANFLPGIIYIPLVLLIFFVLDSINDTRFHVPSNLLLPIFASAFAFAINFAITIDPISSINTAFLLATYSLLVLNNRILEGSHVSEYNGLKEIAIFSAPLLLPISGLIFIEGNGFFTRFMNGDFRNVSLGVKNIVQSGYIPPEMQGFYPANYYFLNAVGVVNFNSENSILPYLSGIALSFFACLLVMTSTMFKISRNLKLSNLHGALILSTLFLPQIFGFTLINGFATGIWAFALLLVFNSTFFLVLQSKSKISVASVLLYVILGLHIWAFIVPILLAGTAVLFISLMRMGKIHRSRLDEILLVAVTLYTILSTKNLKPANLSPLDLLRSEGGIQSLNIFAVLLVLVLFLFVLRQFHWLYLLLGSQLITVTGIYLAIGLIRQPQAFDGYYNIKLFWIVAFSTFPLILALLATLKEFSTSKVKGITLLALIIGLVSTTSSLYPVPSTAYILGLNKISPSILKSFNGLTSEGDYVFWFFKDPPTDRIGTFWLSFRNNPVGNSIDFNNVAAWAYGQTGRTADLCQVIEQNPGITIISRFPQTINTEIEGVCPELSGAFKILVEP